MARKKYKIENGATGQVEWDGGSAPAAVNVVGGVTLMAIRTDRPPELGSNVKFGQVHYDLAKPRISTVRGMHVFHVVKRTPE